MKKKIQVATVLVTFIPVLMTGSVPNIVKAGIDLDNSLTKIESG